MILSKEAQKYCFHKNGKIKQGIGKTIHTAKMGLKGELSVVGNTGRNPLPRVVHLTRLLSVLGIATNTKVHKHFAGRYYQTKEVRCELVDKKDIPKLVSTMDHLRGFPVSMGSAR